MPEVEHFDHRIVACFGTLESVADVKPARQPHGIVDAGRNRTVDGVETRGIDQIGVKRCFAPLAFESSRVVQGRPQSFVGDFVQYIGPTFLLLLLLFFLLPRRGFVVLARVGPVLQHVVGASASIGAFQPHGGGCPSFAKIR